MSTTGTASEVYHYFRLLFSSLGVPYCPRCGIPGGATDAGGITDQVLEQFEEEEIWVLAPLIRGRKGHHREIIQRAAKRGFEQVRIDGKVFPASETPKLDRYLVHDVEAVVSRRKIRRRQREEIRSEVDRALDAGGGMMIVARVERKGEEFYSTRQSCPQCGAGLPVPDPRLFTWSQKFGACPLCEGSGLAWTPSEDNGEPGPCQACGGTRLRPEALAIRLQDRNIGEIARLTIRGATAWVQDLGPTRQEVSQRIIPELTSRLALLEDLGVGYLTLDRAVGTLSTGEAQRIRITAELASNLRGVCYVLDEPTVGLHPRDTEALLKALSDLRDRGNTVVVVEHEEPVIRSADYVIDMGPGAGRNGGRVVSTGSPRALQRSRKSVTGAWLRGDGQSPEWARHSLEEAERLTVVGATLHNLKNVTVEIPLGRLVCVTGVSGSGKSTLVRDVVYRALRAKLFGRPLPAEVRDLRGWEKIQNIKEVDESPIGRTPRSVPATYVGIMDTLRDLFAQTPDARARGYRANRFSFNVGGGRCERCEGHGRHKVEMPLLPVVYIPCDACGGNRYNPDTLAVTLKGRNIAEVLRMSVDEAVVLFEAFPHLVRPLRFLAEIGLGYLQLGQPSPTLSGGEAQRTKLAAEMANGGNGRSFYVLDEPTTGLHMADVAKLLAVLQRLVDRGDTVVVIEHDLDVVAAADCIIDLGPEGGEKGGQVVAWGPPEQIARSKESRTASYLREYLRRQKRKNNFLSQRPQGTQS
jgi:excinuclease ABC subunit A